MTPLPAPAPETSDHADVRAMRPQDAPPAYAMQCMEVWGGNVLREEHLQLTGINGWLYSKPYRGAVATASTPARPESGAAGGDIHYVSMCANGRIARFVVADVAGHGAAVRQLAEALRRLMRRHINEPNQTQFARQLNSAFSSLDTKGRFATAIVATYWAPTDHLIVTNAGHPRPLHYSAARAEWSLLGAGESRADSVPGIRNLPLGVLEPTDYEQFAVALAPGDIVAIYTDALIEAKDGAGRQLGEAGLLELAGTCPHDTPAGFGRALLDTVLARTGPLDADDVTIMVLHHTATAPAKRSLRDLIRVAVRFLGVK